MQNELRSIKGLGEKLENTFKENNIFTCKDLIETLPCRYNIYKIIHFQNIVGDSKVTLYGEIASLVVFRKFRANITSLIFTLLVDGIKIKVLIFGQPHLRFKLRRGMHITVFGNYHFDKKELIASNVFFEYIEFKIEPIYSINGISNQQMQRFVNLAIADYPLELETDLPMELIKKYRLFSYSKLIPCAHFPRHERDLIEIMRRVKFQDFFNYALSLEALRFTREKVLKKPKKVDEEYIQKFINELPYNLTEDQKSAVNTILSELNSEKVMNRLVQGDVGSGKSIVALISALASISAGYQVVIMAPTEILAKQHFDVFTKLLINHKIHISLLTSSTKNKDRLDILERLVHHRIHILVGTHALLEERVIFNNLGLAIIDEQQRFGVNARSKLIEKNNAVDALFLTATPIPRTLGLTSFGDLSISSIKTMPQGRKKVITEVCSENQMNILFNKVLEVCEAGNQVYVIVPLVSESDSIKAYDLEYIYKMFSEQFPEYEIGKLHGKMKETEKKQAMQDFLNRKTKILVSTTVIEVGIDVKNATLMIIFNAERFGLSQIHQLRGRVGRNDLQSYCYLISNDFECPRLKILVNCDDGFELSNQDFLLRGPGDYFGEKQSGLLTLEYGNFQTDFKIWECALMEAKEYYLKYIEGKETSLYISTLVQKVKTGKINLN